MNTSKLKNHKSFGAAVFAFGISITSASAASLVTNGNFESGGFTAPPQGWGASAGVGSWGQDWNGQYVVNPAFAPSTRLPSDSALLYMTGTQDAWQGAWQQIGTFDSNTNYAYSTYAGVRWDFGYSGTVKIELSATKGALPTLNLGSVTQTFDIAATGEGSADWYSLAGSYTNNPANSAYYGGQLWVTISQVAGKPGGGGLGGMQANFDNVAVNSTLVPEPNAALLGGLGLIALLRRRRA